MPAQAPTIASGAVRKMRAALADAGVDPAAFFAGVGLDPAVVADPDGRVPLEKLHALWEAAVRVLPRADASVLAAERYSPGDYGLVGFIAMNSATLREGIRDVVRYVGLWTDDPGMALHDDGTLAVAYRTPFADRPGLRLATEATLAELLHGARLLTQTRITPREVRFRHGAPADLSAHAALFGCAVRFGASDDAMVLGREDLALPLPKADPQLGAYLRTLANEALEKRAGAETSPLHRVREVLAEELQKGLPSIGRVARRVATSERTLRRRLEANGGSFRALLDETRAELARSYVSDVRLPLSEVAFLLGFSERSAFNRAFKRWTDATPSEWRARTGAGRDSSGAR